MNQYTVVGYKRSKGEFNGISFDNYLLYCLRDSSADRGEYGQVAEIIKIKSSDLPSVPSIGSIVSPVYDRYGRVIELV